MSLAEAQSQVKGLESNISSLEIKLSELDKSPFQNFIAKTTGARESLEGLQTSQKRLRDIELAAGMASQNISEIKLAALDEEGKALEKINQEYRDRRHHPLLHHRLLLLAHSHHRFYHFRPHLGSLKIVLLSHLTAKPVMPPTL